MKKRLLTPFILFMVIGYITLAIGVVRLTEKLISLENMQETYVQHIIILSDENEKLREDLNEVRETQDRQTTQIYNDISIIQETLNTQIVSLHNDFEEVSSQRLFVTPDE